MKAKTETTSMIRVDRRLWTGPALSRLIVYALDVAHLVLAPEPVVDYERTALFKEKARVSLDDGQYLVECSLCQELWTGRDEYSSGRGRRVNATNVEFSWFGLFDRPD